MDTDLLCNLFLFISGEGCKCIKLCSDQERYRSLCKINQYELPYSLVRTRQRLMDHWMSASMKTTLTLLKPLACLYHSLTEFNVLFLDKSNMNKMATASLQTSGNMFTNSRCPPKSQIEKVIVVRRTEIVFSIKLTPVWVNLACLRGGIRLETHPASGYNPRQNYLRRISPWDLSFLSASLQPCRLWSPRCKIEDTLFERGWNKKEDVLPTYSFLHYSEVKHVDFVHWNQEQRKLMTKRR